MSQLQNCSKNTHAPIEAYEILLVLQQLPSNSNCANFNFNTNIISRQSQSFTTAMPNLDRKIEIFDSFEDSVETSLKIQNQLYEDDKIQKLHTVMRNDSLQTLKNMNQQPRPRKLVRNPSSFFEKKHQTSINVYSNAKISHFCLQSFKSKVKGFC